MKARHKFGRVDPLVRNIVKSCGIITRTKIKQDRTQKKKTKLDKIRQIIKMPTKMLKDAAKPLGIPLSTAYYYKSKFALGRF